MSNGHWGVAGGEADIGSGMVHAAFGWAMRSLVSGSLQESEVLRKHTDHLQAPFSSDDRVC